MNKRVLLLLSFIIGALLILPLFHVGNSQSTALYSEKMKVYVAGQNAFWLVTFSGLNATTNQILAGIESQNGLDSYSITAIKFGGAIPAYHVFGSDGYGVIGVPFNPREGVFVRINSSNQSLVNSLVAQFDVFLQSSMVPVSTSGKNHTFFSPTSFDMVAAPKLFRFVPYAAKGLASLFTEAQFAALPAPIITFEAVRTASGFDHRVSIGSATSSVLDSSGNLLFASLLRLQPNSTLSASPISNSTTVYVRALAGLVTSTDSAKTGNTLSNFSGYYSISLPAGKSMKANVTILSDPPVALGTRILDHGSVSNGDFLSVTLQVQNLASRAAIENLSVSDSWWKAYPQTFQLATGNYSIKTSSIPAGQNFSSTYVLKIISPDKAGILIPPTWGSFVYRVKNRVFNGHVLFNQAEVRTNDVGPAITLDARPSIRSGVPLGLDGEFVISVRNLGNGPALNLRIMNYTQPSLAQSGGIWRLNASMPLTSLTQRNLTQVFTLSWQTPSGANEQISSNRVMLLFSMTGIHIPYVTVTASARFALDKTPKSVNVTYTAMNTGSANSSSITASQSLPDGLTCVGAVSGKAGSCQGGRLSLDLGGVGKSPSSTTFKLTLAHDGNFVVMPLNVTAKYKGLTLHTYSSSVVIPGGFSITKTFQPSALFGGMKAKVTVTTSDAGPLNVYNVTFLSPADSFDTLVGQQQEGLYQLVEPNRTLSLNYTVMTDVAQSGKLTASPINASFILGGMLLSHSFPQGPVILYKSLTFSVTTAPASPVEGRPFSTNLSIDNTAPIAVSQVHLAVPLPSGLRLLNSTASDVTVSNGVLIVDRPQLLANSSYAVKMSFRASSGLQVDLSKSNLTFLFQGATVKGQSPNQTIVVNEDVYTRYAEPAVLAALVMLAAVVVIRRRVPTSTGSAATSPSSQRETPQKQP